MLRVCDVIRRQLDVVYPFENGKIPDPQKDEAEEEIIEVSPELQIAPQEDTVGIVDGPLGDASEGEEITESPAEAASSPAD